MSNNRSLAWVLPLLLTATPAAWCGEEQALLYFHLPLGGVSHAPAGGARFGLRLDARERSIAHDVHNPISLRSSEQTYLRQDAFSLNGASLSHPFATSAIAFDYSFQPGREAAICVNGVLLLHQDLTSGADEEGTQPTPEQQGEPFLRALQAMPIGVFVGAMIGIAAIAAN